MNENTKKVVMINVACLLTLMQIVTVSAGWDVEVWATLDDYLIKERTYVDYSNTTYSTTEYSKKIEKTYETSTTTTNSVQLSSSVKGLGAEISKEYSWSKGESITYEDNISKTIPGRTRWVLTGKVYGEFCAGWAEYRVFGLFLTDYTYWEIITPEYVITTEKSNKIN